MSNICSIIIVDLFKDMMPLQRLNGRLTYGNVGSNECGARAGEEV